MTLNKNEIDYLYEIADICDIRDDYSGRGMFGETTTGIVLESTYALKNIITSLTEIAEAFYEDGEYEDAETVDNLINKLSNARRDSMGLDIIVY